jgi:alcohol dehydrogenase class IV
MQQVLRFNRPAIEERMGRVAAYLGIAGGFDGFYEFVGELKVALGIPKTLTALGVTEPDVARLTEMALADPTAGGNPVTMTRENTAALIEACL